MDVTNSEDINSARQDDGQKAGHEDAAAAGPETRTTVRERTLEDERRAGSRKTRVLKTKTEAMENLTPKQRDDINIIRLEGDSWLSCIMARVPDPDNIEGIRLWFDRINDGASNLIAGVDLRGCQSPEPSE